MYSYLQQRSHLQKALGMCCSSMRFQKEDFKVTWHTGGSFQDIQGTINWKMPTQHNYQEKNALLLHIVKFSKFCKLNLPMSIFSSQSTIWIPHLQFFSANSLAFIWDASKLIRINSFSLHNLLLNKQNLKIDNYLLIPDSVMSTFNTKSCFYWNQFDPLLKYHHIYWLQWRIYIRYSLTIW